MGGACRASPTDRPWATLPFVRRGSCHQHGPAVPRLRSRLAREQGAATMTGQHDPGAGDRPKQAIAADRQRRRMDGPNAMFAWAAKPLLLVWLSWAPRAGVLRFMCGAQRWRGGLSSGVPGCRWTRVRTGAHGRDDGIGSVSAAPRVLDHAQLLGATCRVVPRHVHRLAAARPRGPVHGSGLGGPGPPRGCGATGSRASASSFARVECHPVRASDEWHARERFRSNRRCRSRLMGKSVGP